MKRLFAQRWIPQRLYVALPWAAVGAGFLGLACPGCLALTWTAKATLAYGAFVLGMRLAWFGCGEV